MIHPIRTFLHHLSIAIHHQPTPIIQYHVMPPFLLMILGWMMLPPLVYTHASIESRIVYTIPVLMAYLLMVSIWMVHDDTCIQEGTQQSSPEGTAIGIIPLSLGIYFMYVLSICLFHIEYQTHDIDMVYPPIGMVFDADDITSICIIIALNITPLLMMARLRKTVTLISTNTTQGWSLHDHMQHQRGTPRWYRMRPSPTSS